MVATENRNTETTLRSCGKVARLVFNRRGRKGKKERWTLYAGQPRGFETKAQAIQWFRTHV